MTRTLRLALALGAALGLALAATPREYVERIEIGINANWAYFNPRIRTYREAIPAAFRAIGFDHVRIRARADLDPGYLEHLERVVQDSLRAGLTPILAFNGGSLNLAPSTAEARRGVRWWERVAARFADYPEALAFDLFIEPAKAMNPHPHLLRTYYQEAIAAIRKTNPTRLLFLAPRYAANPAYLPELEPLFASDPYLAAESHFYAAGPSKTKPAKRWTTGTPAERERVQRRIDQIVAWRERTGVPVWQ